VGRLKARLSRRVCGLTPDEEVQRKAILADCPELDTAAGLVTSFAEMPTHPAGNRLTEWITEAMTSDCPGSARHTTRARTLLRSHSGSENGIHAPSMKRMDKDTRS